jgi:hypothetical protein
MNTGLAPSEVTSLSDGGTIASGSETMEGLTTGQGDSMPIRLLPHRYDLQSNDGYGQLLAADSFFCAINSVNTGLSNTIFFRMYYRLVQVGVDEYVGIVQSQMSS